MSDAVPKPSDVVVEFTQTGAGVAEGGKKGTVSQRKGSLDARLLLPCANPECKKGGFLLRPEVDKAARAAKTEVSLEIACSGYTGAVRRESGPATACPNRLAARVTLAYPKTV